MNRPKPRRAKITPLYAVEAIAPCECPRTADTRCECVCEPTCRYCFVQDHQTDPRVEKILARFDKDPDWLERLFNERSPELDGVLALALSEASNQMEWVYDWLRLPGIPQEAIDEMAPVVSLLEATFAEIGEIVRRYRPDDHCDDCTTGYQCQTCRNRDRIAQGLAPYIPAEEHRARNYGITVVELQRLLNRAGGRCEICRSVLVAYHIDHNHDTGEVRGILCRACNTALGVFKDDPEILDAASAYLRERGHYGHLRSEAG